MMSVPIGSLYERAVFTIDMPIAIAVVFDHDWSGTAIIGYDHLRIANRRSHGDLSFITIPLRNHDRHW
jgi:hypothetical protein